MHNTDLSSLSSPELLKQTQDLVAQERELGIQILHRLREISKRRLHLELGYSSLFTYLVKELLYPESSAFRLVNALNLTTEIPETEEKISSGSLSISSVALVQSYCKAQKRENNLVISTEEKKEILSAIEGHSKRETEKILSTLHPDQPLVMSQERTRVVQDDLVEIRLHASSALMKKLERIKDLMGPKNTSYSELLDWMAEIVLNQKDPIRKADRAEKKAAEKEKLHPSAVNQESTPSQKNSEQKTTTETETFPIQLHPCKVKRKPIQTQTQQEVRQRDRHQCAYISPITGKRCTETRGLQIDHKLALGKGGSDFPENLQLLCFSHHQAKTFSEYGEKQISSKTAKSKYGVLV